MSWEQEVKEIERRRYLAQQQGGKEGIAKQHARGRMTIRERIDVLLDDGTFQEHGRATASPVYDENDELIEYVPANYVVGFGQVDKRRIVAAGEDFTLKGGSPNAAGLRHFEMPGRNPENYHKMYTLVQMKPGNVFAATSLL